MVVCRAANVRQVREGSLRVFVTAPLQFADAITGNEILRTAFIAVTSGADSVSPMSLELLPLDRELIAGAHGRARRSRCGSSRASPRRSARGASSTSRPPMSTAASISGGRASISPSGWQASAARSACPRPSTSARSISSIPSCFAGQRSTARTAPGSCARMSSLAARRPSPAPPTRAPIARASARRSPGGSRTRSPSPIP